MSGKTGWVEKRQQERIVTTMKVGYRIIESHKAKDLLAQNSYRNTTTDQLAGLSQVSPLYEAVTKDISLGGLSIVSDQPISVGSVVEVGLSLPNYQMTLKFLAEIVRTEPFVEMGRSMQRSGVKTLAINQEDVTRMEQYLIEKMRKK
ncbi:MAG: PilZ domain-containing protein [bacterium]